MKSTVIYHSINQITSFYPFFNLSSKSIKPISNRTTIKEQTSCTCTIGCSHNLLMARIATAKYLFIILLIYRAKPDGFLYIPFTEISSFLLTTSIGNLPGVGNSLEGKLHQLNIQTCQDLLQTNPVFTFLQFIHSIDTSFKYNWWENSKSTTFICIWSRYAYSISSIECSKYWSSSLLWSTLPNTRWCSEIHMFLM